MYLLTCVCVRLCTVEHGNKQGVYRNVCENMNVSRNIWIHSHICVNSHVHILQEYVCK